MPIDKLIEAIKHVDVAGKSIQMYSENHPRTQQSIEQAFTHLTNELQGRSSLTVSVTEGNLLIEGETIDKGNPLMERFTKDLFSRNIHSLTFVRGLARSELISFMRSLNLKPQRIRDLGGFEKVLETESVKNIQANRVKYGIIGTAQTGAAEDQALISQLLMALQAAGMAGTGEAAANLEKSIGDAPDPADSVFRVFATLAQNLPNLPAEQQQGSAKERFLHMFRSFSPEMQGKLLLSAVLKSASMEKSPLSGFYRELSPEEMEAAIFASLQQAESEQDLRAMLQSLTQDKSITLPESVKKKLAETGLLEPPVKPNPWDELVQKEIVTPEEIEKTPGFFNQMLAAGMVADADRLSKKLFGYLATGTREQKIATIKSIPGIVVALSHNEKWKSIDVSLNFLLNNCFRKETDLAVVASFLTYWMVPLGRNFEAGKWRECQDLMNLIKSKAVNQEPLPARLSDELKQLPEAFVQAVRQGGPACEQALEVLKTCGRAGAGYLLEVLADEEDQKIRKHLLGLIEGLDSAQLMPEIEKRLSDSRWYVVRNMVTILGKMSSPESARLLEQAAACPEAKVAKEIVKKLFNASAPSDEPIVVRLMMHVDKPIRMQAVHLAGMMRAASTVPVLLQIVADKNPIDTDLRAAAYQTLLKIKPDGAVSPALSLLERKAAGKAEAAERNAAVKVLGEINREQHRPILEKIASGDANSETRQLAQSYL